MTSKKNDLKSQIKLAAADKREATKARVEYKRETPPGSIQRERVIQGFWTTNGELKRRLRCLQLAYAFVRNRSYWRTERHAEKPIDFAEVARLAEATTDEIESWVNMPVPDEDLCAWRTHLSRARDEARIARSAA
jgi:hypothetical protein